MTHHETLQAGVAGRGADGGLYLAPGSHATGGAPCSERCVQAHEALRLGAAFLQMLIDEYGSLPAGGDVPVTEQLRLLEAV